MLLTTCNLGGWNPSKFVDKFRLMGISTSDHKDLLILGETHSCSVVACNLDDSESSRHRLNELEFKNVLSASLLTAFAPNTAASTVYISYVRD